MIDRSLIALSLSPALALLLSLPILSPARAAEERRVEEPVAHDNLAIYFIKGTSETGPVPRTLDEALEKGAVKVHETQEVSELEIENTGDEAIFVHAGDIVKGGQQDRVLTVTILVPPKSGRIPISSYCVERGRWSARGGEDVKTFASAKNFIPTLEGKRAMRSAQKAEVYALGAAPPPEEQLTTTGSLSGNARPAAGESERVEQQQLNNSLAAGLPIVGPPDAQGEVWSNVSSLQSALGTNLAAGVTAAASPTSLQLALESEELAKAQEAYIGALEAAGEKDDDVIGLVVAVNGELTSADVYPSNALFRKFWSKHLKAAATEAISRRDGASASVTPAKADAEAFLKDGDAGEKHKQELNDALNLEISEGKATESFASRSKSGALLHMNLLKK